MSSSFFLFFRFYLRIIYAFFLISFTTQSWGAEPLKLTAHEQMLSNWVTKDFLPSFNSELNNLCGTNFIVQIDWQSFSGNLPEFDEDPADFLRISKFLFNPLTNALQKVCRYDYTKQALQENIAKIIFQRTAHPSSTNVEVILPQKSIFINLYSDKGEGDFFRTQTLIEDAINDPKAGFNLELRKNKLELVRKTQEYVQEITQTCKQPTNLEVDLDSFIANHQASLISYVDDYFFNPLLLALDQLCNNDYGSKTLADLGVRQVKFIYVPSESQRSMQIKEGVLIIYNYLNRASLTSSWSQNQIYMFLAAQPSIKH